MSAIPSGEVARSLYGAWRLLRGDRQAMRCFDGTPGAAIRSFWAAAIGAPMYAVILAFAPGAPHAASPTRAAIVFAIGYVVTWSAYPLAIAYVANALGRWPRYFRYVAVYNWASIVQYALVLLATLLAEFLPVPVAGLVLLAAMLVALVYEWFIARVALEISPLAAAGIVALDVAISVIVNAVATRLA